jgi:SPASM domain peptide maturase of grasp-with-spasm system
MQQDALRPSSGDQQVFRLYPTCKLVKGGAYSAIYDLDRRLLFRFDSAYLPLFELAETGIRVDELGQLDPLPRARSLEAIAFLRAKEVGRYLDPVSATYMTPLQDQWDSANTLLSAIVDVDETEPDWKMLIAELDKLQTRFVQVRCFSDLIDRRAAEHILRGLRGTRITRIELLLKWGPEWDDEDWKKLFDEFRNLQRVRLHSAPADNDLLGEVVSDLPLRLVRFEKRPVDSAHHCGTISEGSLSAPSAWLYSELRHFNGCLNRKVAIRADGQICNCPSMRTTFGSELSRLDEIVKSREFQRPWSINKDVIGVCSGCEFRYVCTDCRAYLGDDLSTEKPARCHYDPAAGRWAA